MWRRALSRLFVRRDPYDLSQLREVHEERAWRPGDPEPVDGEHAMALCPRCGAEYEARLGACPRCGAGGFRF